jgi:8-oxo-dGTP pyrophosphatase MutT (NUDIX family)
LVREIAEELGVDAKITGFVGKMGHRYIEDGVTHHELNFVFEVITTASEPTNTGSELVSQENHLEFHWLPLEQLADADVRPAALKDALLAAHGGTPGGGEIRQSVPD